MQRLLMAGLATCLLASLALGDPNVTLRERYPGPDGRPSHAAYLQAEGVAPAPDSERYEWEVVFTLAYCAEDANRLETATPVATDCCLVRTRTFRAPWRMVPVWDGRVYQDRGRLVVAEFSPDRERVVGTVTEDGVTLAPGAGMEAMRRWEGVRFDPFTGLLWRKEPGGEITETQRYYLPFPLVDAQGERVLGAWSINRREGGEFAVTLRAPGMQPQVLATCRPSAESIISRQPGYSPELGPGCTMAVLGPTEIVQVRGVPTPALALTGADPVLAGAAPPGAVPGPEIAIDGDFSDWRSLPGITDPRGDIPWYLEYNPDTDLLEFKVASDDRYLYCYTRVAGRHGNTKGKEDRYYYYVYIDADRDPATGYVPTRDDDCYYGVTLGDDCEAQFEFVNGRFVKTFFGFTGAGTEREVLAGRVKLGPSWYGREDERGRVRDRYKVEYVARGGKRAITADYTEGTSDDIVIALSPDGSECELRVELAGFLHDAAGRQIIAPGQRIDLAVGIEASGKVHGKKRWGADSTTPIHGYGVAGSPLPGEQKGGK